MSSQDRYVVPAGSKDEAQAIYDAQEMLQEAWMSWILERDGDAITASFALQKWPDVTVELSPCGPAPVIAGVFSEDGTLRQLQFDASYRPRGVQASDLRHMPAVSSLKAWEVAAREYGRQILAGVPKESIVFDTTSPAAALESLSRSVRRKPGARARAAAAHEALLRRVASAYEEAAGSRAPRKVVAERLGYSAAHVSRLLAEARRPRDGRPPLLGPGRAGRPRTRRSTGHSGILPA